MKKKMIALFLCALLLFAGCSAQSPATSLLNNAGKAADMEPMAPMEEISSTQAEAGWGSASSTPAPAAEAPQAAPQGEAAASNGGHKIIKNASISLETRLFDEHTVYIRQRVEELGGYVSSSSTWGRKPENYGDRGRTASIVVRVPQQSMELFLADARGLATVTSEMTGGDDITSAYYDSESRLNIYTTQYDRILVLLEKAETMEDIIALETELSRLTYEIEALTTQLRRWDDLVSFATVNIDISEILPTNLTPTTSNDSFSTRVSEGFSRTLQGLGAFFETLLVYILIASPVLIALLVILAVVLIIRRHRKKKRLEKGIVEPPPLQSVYGAPTPSEEEKPKE